MYLTFCIEWYPSHQIITEIEQATSRFITGYFSSLVSHQKDTQITKTLKRRREKMMKVALLSTIIAEMMIDDDDSATKTMIKPPTESP